ncbi:hypothetical protein GobsT_20080 [Gemmata obscuriglobus]|nr:DUF3160 domain-containing protein [Gemmata obscuriglobus]QEG27254.1 hypothetical protein GobsT_20080 [Gemmata obscuriglobus]VTS04024.1 Leucine-rich repeat (LRR) protein OS=Microcoleus sp. PCC 7113 GN=Mic7113_2682 PE=4 SV=1: DUF3160 [Gemmata obscuriglobus UQM 2246]
MNKLLPVVAVAVLVGVWAVPAPAADEKKPLKHLEGQIFDQILAKHQDLTFDQLKGRAVKPRAYSGIDFDPTKTAHFDTVKTKLGLTDDELALFKKAGFVSIDQNRRHSFASAYFQIYSADLPVLVTTDSVLHAMHKSYDDILMDMERAVFVPTVRQILADTHAKLSAPYAGGAAPESVADVDLYLTVARNLLEGAGAPADEVDYAKKPTWDGKLKVRSNHGQDEAVQALLSEVRELKLKAPHVGSAPTKIYGGERYPDFSQFRPRGHYTKAQELKNYFRCMMWLGRVDCGWNVLPTDDTPGVKANSDRELTAAILFCEALKESGSLKALKSLDDIIGFMVGRSDNLTVFALLDVCAKLGTASAKGTVKDLDKVKAELKSGKLAAQMIRSQLVLSDIGSTIKVPPPAVFQVFGQRFILDSFVLSQVVFDSIVFKNQKMQRMMPTGLDALAALGSDEAVLLLEPELKRWNYSANLLACRDFINLHPETYWKSNLYVLWLDCLRALNADMTGHKRFPQAMRSKGWAMKQLNTQLGSWAELRHDTILYAKQSYTGMVTCEYPAGYVEPYPEFYAKVKFFADEAGKLFAAAEFPGLNAEAKKGYVTFFRQFSATVGQLETLAKKELAGEAFTDAEKAFIKKTVDARGGGSGPPRYDGWYPKLFFNRDECAKWAPVVADVHTDPASQSCLEVAVGDTMFGVIAVDNDTDRMTYVGPLYSYYEFRQPVDKRLTDPEWHQMIAQGKVPARPEWTREFVAPTRKAGTGR